MASSNTIIQLTATSHFPIKLTPTNFPVWRKQVQSTLIGLDLDGFISGGCTPPKTISDEDITNTNPTYIIWYRQDQIIFSAILGSCSDAIQPIITSASTAKEAWDRLCTSYASQSRSRIISLKSKLAKNPKGNRSITDFLNDMRSIADELAIAQSPIDEEDLLVHILSQLGNEYGPITAAIKVRETSIPFSELFDKLADFERSLKETESVAAPFIATTNFSQRQTGRFNTRSSSESQYRTGRFGSDNQPRNSRSNNNTHHRNNRSSSYCHFLCHSRSRDP